MKKFILLVCLFLIPTKCFAFNIVYPAKNDVTINSKSTFFIGSSDTPLKINGNDVPRHISGGFAYVVNLENGTNTFVIQSGDERQIFVITRPVLKSTCKLPVEFKMYNEKRPFYVVTENAPLRSTPVDAGINRMAHLQRNVALNVDGEKNGFYRVVLDKDNFGWIAKSNVKEFQNYENKPAVMTGYDYDDSEEYFTFIFHLDKRVPYEITEGTQMNIKFFNISEIGTYVMDFPAEEAMCGKKLLGYSGEYQGNDFVWKIRKPPVINHKKPLHNIKIAIDAGHGGYENGAKGCFGDKEKDINLIISKNLEDELKKRGAKVIMTRTDDSYKSLKERVDIANAQDAMVLLSIHANALPDGADPNKISGTSVYYYYEQAKPLAQEIFNTMTQQLSTNDDKVRQASLALVRNTNALSLLIETAYLVNPDDNVKLVSPEFQKACAKAIADALEKYFQK